MAEPASDEDSGPLAWCVVANVRDEIPYGEGGLEIRAGTRHFTSGTKVWVLPSQWGDGGEKVLVIGRHRGRPGGHVRMVLDRRHLTNYRVRGVYQRSVYELLVKPWNWPDRPPRMWESREAAERTLEWWCRPTLDAQFVDAPGRVPPYQSVSDPPPQTLTVDGIEYHLAHFNANRAVYSALPPPTEPGGDDLG